MKYATPDAFRVAAEQRLLARSKDAGVALPRLRKAVVFDRFLARLLVVAPDRWHGKGGLALDLRYGARARSTKDMDLGYGDADEATEELMAASGLDLGDFFRFATQQTNQLDVIQEGAAIRFQVAATLAGRRFENV